MDATKAQITLECQLTITHFILTLTKGYHYKLRRQSYYLDLFDNSTSAINTFTYYNEFMTVTVSTKYNNLNVNRISVEIKNKN